MQDYELNWPSFFFSSLMNKKLNIVFFYYFPRIIQIQTVRPISCCSGSSEKYDSYEWTTQSGVFGCRHKPKVIEKIGPAIPNRR